MIGVILVQSLILVIVVIQPVFLRWQLRIQIRLDGNTCMHLQVGIVVFVLYLKGHITYIQLFLSIHAGTWLLEVRILYGSMYMKYRLLRVQYTVNTQECMWQLVKSTELNSMIIYLWEMDSIYSINVCIVGEFFLVMLLFSICCLFHPRFLLSYGMFKKIRMAPFL